MASNDPALDTPLPPGAALYGDAPGEDESWEEWDPTEESVRAVRGRHRVAKQRGGLARSSTVLGVGVIAAVGAGGMATAQSKPPVSISLPDSLAGSLPDLGSLPGVGALLSHGGTGADAHGGTGADAHGGTGVDAHGDASKTAAAEADRKIAAAPLSMAGLSTSEAEGGATDAGEALRARILQQAGQQKAAAVAEAKAAAEKAAAQKAAAEAKAKQEAAKVQAAAEAAKAAAEKKAAEEAAAKKAEQARLAELAAEYSLPVGSYTITSTFGEAGSMWSSGHHTGLDFAAPTGTPLKAIHSGTVKSAGWAGAYGYRTVITLEDGSELWYCHQSSIAVGAGQKVTTGEVVGRVGATGNVTGPHLHLEVHAPSGTGIDPMTWLRSKGLKP
ncbi:M23 family metallopeptidase [Streptomyces sp. NPDC048416]|uniref:M23 family metallopeptidase n=1 Tax=Streptomyces sp. NPDC048416 TaxID=3365546 RepID=UPI003716B175